MRVRKKMRGFVLDVEVEVGNAIVLGPNGSGKSTLLKCLAGVYLCEGDVFDDALYVPPIPQLPPGTTVGEYVRHISKTLGVEFVDFFDVGPFLGKRVEELSTGMAYRVVLSLAFSTDRRLLLDEPLSSLDAKWRLRLVELLSGRRFMVATHDPLPFLPLNPDVVVLEEGRVKAVAKAEAVRALYLEKCGGGLCARPGGAVPVVGYDVSA